MINRNWFVNLFKSDNDELDLYFLNVSITFFNKFKFDEGIYFLTCQFR